MKNIFFSLLVLGVNLLLISACSPQSKHYETELYSLEYPGSWKMTDEKGLITFTPNEEIGIIKLKKYSQINFPPPFTKNFMVEMHKLPVTQDQINAKEVGDHFEFYFDYAENNKHIISKGMRKNSDLFLLHSTCDSKKWPALKNEFLGILESFQFK
jgi:hypothetical protein